VIVSQPRFESNSRLQALPGSTRHLSTDQFGPPCRAQFETKEITKGEMQ
jgi:hypothetical protein